MVMTVLSVPFNHEHRNPAVLRGTEKLVVLFLLQKCFSLPRQTDVRPAAMCAAIQYKEQACLPQGLQAGNFRAADVHATVILHCTVTHLKQFANDSRSTCSRQRVVFILCPGHRICWVRRDAGYRMAVTQPAVKSNFPTRIHCMTDWLTDWQTHWLTKLTQSFRS
jgi:hypothetical protein